MFCSQKPHSKHGMCLLYSVGWFRWTLCQRQKQPNLVLVPCPLPYHVAKASWFGAGCLHPSLGCKGNRRMGVWAHSCNGSRGFRWTSSQTLLRVGTEIRTCTLQKTWGSDRQRSGTWNNQDYRLHHGSCCFVWARHSAVPCYGFKTSSKWVPHVCSPQPAHLGTRLPPVLPHQETYRPCSLPSLSLYCLDLICVLPSHLTLHPPHNKVGAVHSLYHHPFPLPGWSFPGEHPHAPHSISGEATKIWNEEGACSRRMKWHWASWRQQGTTLQVWLVQLSRPSHHEHRHCSLPGKAMPSKFCVIGELLTF